MSNLTGSFNPGESATITGDSDFTYPQDIECTSIICDEVITDSITTNDLLVNTDLDLHGNILVNNVTISPTEISYLNNCNGNIQQQINDITSGGAIAHLDYNGNENAVECDVNFKVDGNIINTGISNINTKLTDISYSSQTTNIGSSSSNTLLIKSNIDNRGDGKSIYATADLSTTNDIYMNCYNNTWLGQTRTYNYYKLYDFINNENNVTRAVVVEVGATANNAQNTANNAQTTANNAQNTANQAISDANGAWNRAGDAKSRADDAYDKATNAQSTADGAVATGAINATAIAGVATALSLTNTTVAGHTADLVTLNTQVATLEGKTQFMAVSLPNTTVFTSDVTINLVNTPIISLTKTGDINCYTINTSGLYTQNLDGATVNIGHVGSTINIMGIPYVPYNPLSSVNQWTAPTPPQ